MYYFISYYKKEEYMSEGIIHNDVIKVHPFKWNGPEEAVIINWKEISKEEYELYLSRDT